MKVFLIVLFILQSVAFAQDCAEVNLVTKPDSPFNKIPVYDQSGSGMCYAYAASELMNYELLKSGATKELEIHPFWAGVSQGVVTNDARLRGGTSIDTIKGILQRGNCPYNSVSHAISSLARIVGVKEARIIAFIDSYGKIIGRSLRYGTPTKELIHQALKEAALKNLRGCTYSDWTKIFSEMENFVGNGVQIADQLLAASCKEENVKKLDLKLPQQVGSGSDEALQKNIFDALDNNNPSAMTFCSWVTDRASSANLRNVNLNENGYRVFTDDSPNVCGAHVAMIVGKKQINNQCHVLYYNSFGSQWNSYNRHLTCLCKRRSTGEFVDNCKASTHSGGLYSVEACWVPAESLISNIVTVEHY